MTSYMYYISDSRALLPLRYGDLIVSWFIHSFIPSIHPMLNGQRSLIYDNILLLCSTFLCTIARCGIRCGAGTWWKAMKMLDVVQMCAPAPPPSQGCHGGTLLTWNAHKMTSFRFTLFGRRVCTRFARVRLMAIVESVTIFALAQVT